MADDGLGRLGNKLGPLPVWAWSLLGAGVIVGGTYLVKGRKGTAVTGDQTAGNEYAAAQAYGSTGGVSDTGGGFASTGTGDGVDLSGINAQLSALQTQAAAIASRQDTLSGQVTRLSGAAAATTRPATGGRSTSGSGTRAAAALRTLRQGSRGADVKALQAALAKAGFNPGPIDAVYGSQTAAAVRAYQRSRGLSVDAIAGPQTLGALAANRGMVASPAASAPGHPALPGLGGAGTWSRPGMPLPAPGAGPGPLVGSSFSAGTGWT